MAYPKNINTLSYPVQAKDVSGLLTRVEPLLTPAKLKSRFLKGVLEKLPNNISYSNDELKDQINLAINDLELELKTPIFAVKFSERHPFDYNLYKNWIHIRTNNGPILSIEDWSIVSSDNQNIFRIPPEWIDMGNAHQRQVNMIPLLGLQAGGVAGTASPGGVAYLMILERQLSWLPAYWTIEFTAGFCKDHGQVPIALNNLIGIQTALNILSSVAPNNSNTSVSLSQDGIGQSSSNPGPAIFQIRISELEAKKKTILGQLKRITSQKYFIGNI